MAIVGIETSDKMADKQIVAVVRGHFNQKGQQRASAGLGFGAALDRKPIAGDPRA